ncbi:MAG: ATP-binding protein [Pseudomonadota bacterium]
MRHIQIKTLRTRALILGLLPATILALSITAYLINSQLNSLTDNFAERGRYMAKEAAAFCVYGLFTQDQAILEKNLKPVFHQQDILSIKVFNVSNKLLADLSNTNPEQALPENTKFLTFYEPVIYGLESLEISDYPEQLINTSRSETNNVMGRVIISLSTQRLDRKRQQILENSLFILIIGLLLTALFAVTLSESVINPITRLTQAVKRMKQGDLSVEVPAMSSGELKSLEDAFNEMSVQLKESHESMQQQIDQATSDLTETMEALEIQNVELDLAKKRALQASHAKSRFLANMSHEIRTPMNGVIGFADLLFASGLSSEQKDLVKTISKSARSLLDIINKILDYSKLEYGNLEPEIAPFHIYECFEEPVVLLAPSAHEKGLELVLMIYSDVPKQLIGDETRIRQILVNLLSNAIKFTHTGEVVIRVMLDEVTDKDCVLSFSVTDTGIGIDRKSQDNLFDSFKQADSSTSRMYGGTGLGLSISKKLAQSMNGQIYFESQLGTGSMFQVKLKMTKTRSRNLEITHPPFRQKECLLIAQHKRSQLSLSHQFERLGMHVNKQKDINQYATKTDGYDLVAICFTKDEMDLYIMDNSPLLPLKNCKPPLLILLSSSDRNAIEKFQISPNTWVLPKPISDDTLTSKLHEMFSSDQNVQPLRDAQPAIHKSNNLLAGRNILIVDDNEINLKLVNLLLSEQGASVTQAKDGLQAIHVTSDQSYDLILMDVHMPLIKGTDACRQIRMTNNSNQQTPIVALTADAVPQTRHEIIEAGMNGYLLKPIDNSQLLDVILPLLETNSANSPLPDSTDQFKNTDTNDKLPIRDKDKLLKATGGDQFVADDMFDTFIRELPDEIQTIKKHFNASNWEYLWETVHRLHGATSICGVPALNAAVVQLEAVCKKRHITQTELMISQLEIEAENLLNTTHPPTIV